jgi:hypothetical protein
MSGVPRRGCRTRRGLEAAVGILAVGAAPGAPCHPLAGRRACGVHILMVPYGRSPWTPSVRAAMAPPVSGSHGVPRRRATKRVPAESGSLLLRRPPSASPASGHVAPSCAPRIAEERAPRCPTFPVAGWAGDRPRDALTRPAVWSGPGRRGDGRSRIEPLGDRSPGGAVGPSRGRPRSPVPAPRCDDPDPRVERARAPSHRSHGAQGRRGEARAAPE